MIHDWKLVSFCAVNLPSFSFVIVLRVESDHVVLQIVCQSLHDLFRDVLFQIHAGNTNDSQPQGKVVLFGNLANQAIQAERSWQREVGFGVV